MKEITISAGQALTYAIELLNAAGIKSGAFMPYWKKDPRNGILIKGKPISKKDFEATETADLNFARSYCESKGCEVFLVGVNGGCEDALESLKDYKFTEKQITKAKSNTSTMYAVGKYSPKERTIEGFVINPSQAEDLLKAVEKRHSGKPRVFVVGFTENVDYMDFAGELFEGAFQILTCKLTGHADSVSAFDLARELRDINPNVTETGSPEEAMELASLLASDKGIILRINL
ncbi:MAG: hypothetical protein J5537_09675 [Lachnospiraceae bacterium]|nr:hypothetical protein [Lachnospiraceae bacterium]